MSAANLDPACRSSIESWQRGALIAGAVGLAACLLGGLLGYSQQAFRSYLLAFNVFAGVPLGCLAIVMLQYLTGGTWGFVLRRPLEAGTRTLPVLVLLFLPLALGLRQIYAWAQPPEEIIKDPNLALKMPYLNVAWFLIRAAGYFAIWNVLMLLFNAWSRRADATRDPKISVRCSALAGPGLVLYALTVTFASIDWVMSLEPHWYSTIFGGLYGIGQVLSGFCFCVAMVLMLHQQPELRPVVDRGVLRDLGSLLLAFVMVWAYLQLSQFLLIWSGNLPEETPWYIRRVEQGWGWVAILLFGLHFVLPFVLLLSASLKRTPQTLLAVVLLVLAMRVVDLFWLIVPAYDAVYEVIGRLFDIAALVGVGGIWLGTYLWQVRRWPLLPQYQPPEEGNHER